jgi:hypothetical protein
MQTFIGFCVFFSGRKIVLAPGKLLPFFLDGRFQEKLRLSLCFKKKGRFLKFSFLLPAFQEGGE